MERTPTGVRSLAELILSAVMAGSIPVAAARLVLRYMMHFAHRLPAPMPSLRVPKLVALTTDLLSTQADTDAWLLLEDGPPTATAAATYIARIERMRTAVPAVLHLLAAEGAALDAAALLPPLVDALLAAAASPGDRMHACRIPALRCAMELRLLCGQAAPLTPTVTPADAAAGVAALGSMLWRRRRNAVLAWVTVRSK